MLSPVICSSCLLRSPSGQQDDGEHSHGENDGGDPGNFGVVPWRCDPCRNLA
jgi:hypothetical protein